ncbi:MAG TPA: RsmB/NOP family class I SAM-dependent RNA methyltransferase [Candidatus Acidoferrum sp.]|nr:RsmB/NOP family class I SAM-dependent RNA methyltransferase [Candidatus Acidoferrum sp.]
MRTVQDAVALAIESLSWMEHEGLSERAAFARASKQLKITQTDQLRRAQLLILETTRRRNLIDYLILRASGGQLALDSLQHGIASVLRVFCYWTRLHRADDRDVVRFLHAARSALGWQTLQPIEPVLGRILALDVPEEMRKLPYDEALSLSLFHPVWFVSASSLLLGRPGALKLMQRSAHRPSSYIRINTLLAKEEACLREVEEMGINLEPVPNLPLAFKVLSFRRPILQTEPYREGRIVIQDKASVLASAIAAPKSGDAVLDACAAPGAKTAHLAQLMENKGTIYSVDKSFSRMNFWRREVARLGVKIAHPLLADASKSFPMNTQADVVLLDPPCSNTGTFWKSPAEKWATTPELVGTLARTQRAMLENVSPFVREGGTLVYSTCSILAEENEHVVNSFLAANPDFKAVDQTPRMGLPGLYGSEISQRLYPHIHDCNGHFLSKMQRTG